MLWKSYEFAKINKPFASLNMLSPNSRTFFLASIFVSLRSNDNLWTLKRLKLLYVNQWHIYIIIIYCIKYHVVSKFKNTSRKIFLTSLFVSLTSNDNLWTFKRLKLLYVNQWHIYIIIIYCIKYHVVSKFKNTSRKIFLTSLFVSLTSNDNLWTFKRLKLLYVKRWHIYIMIYCIQYQKGTF